MNPENWVKLTGYSEKIIVAVVVSKNVASRSVITISLVKTTWRHYKHKKIFVTFRKMKNAGLAGCPLPSQYIEMYGSVIQIFSLHE